MLRLFRQILPIFSINEQAKKWIDRSEVYETKYIDDVKSLTKYDKAKIVEILKKNNNDLLGRCWKGLFLCYPLRKRTFSIDHAKRKQLLSLFGIIYSIFEKVNRFYKLF